MALVDDHGDDVVGGRVGDVERFGITRENTGNGRHSEKDKIANFVGGSVDDEKTVCSSNGNVELAAIGFEDEVARRSSKSEIREKKLTAKINDGDLCGGAGRDEGLGAVGKDSNLLRARCGADCGKRSERSGVKERNSRIVVVGNDDKAAVGSSASDPGAEAGAVTRNDLAGRSVNGDDGISAGCSDVSAAAIGRKIERVGLRTDGNASNDLVGLAVEDPGIATGGAKSPDFRASGMDANTGRNRADIDGGDRRELDEIDDGESAIGGIAHVGEKMQAGTKEGGLKLENDFADGEAGKDEKKGKETIVGAKLHALATEARRIQRKSQFEIANLKSEMENTERPSREHRSSIAPKQALAAAPFQPRAGGTLAGKGDSSKPPQSIVAATGRRLLRIEGIN